MAGVTATRVSCSCGTASVAWWTGAALVKAADGTTVAARWLAKFVTTVVFVTLTFVIRLTTVWFTVVMLTFLT
jgi:hypothetical protein